ncbi:MAG: histidine kinase [Flavobacteriia bacterium]
MVRFTINTMLKPLLVLFLLLIVSTVKCQYPPYFSNNVESGAPSNEMYWVCQDAAGYIWIGCDAGLYRFNGVRYEHFTSSDLTARSATGIIQSKTTGRIYAYNFNSQLFYVENGRLHVVKNWKRPVNGIADDGNGGIWITSSEGIFKLNERENRITIVSSQYHYTDKSGLNYTSHGIADPEGNVYYQSGDRVLVSKDGKIGIVEKQRRFFRRTLMISRFSKSPWFISLTGEMILRPDKGTYKDYTNEKLINALEGKKINCVFESRDGKLWIGTYTGLICHDPISRKTELMYDQFSFSFGIQDIEGNYWFSTLHNGLIRIPDMQVRSWTSLNQKGSAEQFTHICADSKNVFIGGSNGFLSVINLQSGDLVKYEHELLSDFGTMYLDPIDNSLYLNKLSNIYRFGGGHFDRVNSRTRPIKCILRLKKGFFMLSSQGLFFTSTIGEPLDERNMIDLDWYRDICKSPFSSSFYVASNSGLKEIVPTNQTYRIGKKYLIGKQIISVCADNKKRKVYIYCFDGGLYTIDQSKQIKKIRQLADDIRVTQIRFYAGQLFMASNKGILVVDTESKKQFLFDRFSGLSSNNIRAIAFKGSNCWAAGESIQRVPLSLFTKKKNRSRIVSRKILINGRSAKVKELIELNYEDKLSLIADGLSYRSNGNFQFAYRIKGLNSNWILVPGGVEKIDFASLPTGYITIELKLIDHQGVDSANVISYKLYVSPPFWQRWWFYLLITLTTLVLALSTFRFRLKAIRKKQRLEMRRLRLENELRLTQQNALKAQMNPHFLFNVLNSIKGYIYENDKKNAARYLSNFSSLVRKVLELSSVPAVSLEQEVEALKLYIDLEAMLLQSDFEYSINMDMNIDVSGVQIPALLLQPYVENAFKHGLRHKSGPKRLSVDIEQNEKEGLLMIQITDNGIGRAAAELLNAQNRGEHRSFATSAMEKRIQLLNFEKKDVVGVEIRDNFERNEPSGTTVIIRIHARES